MNHPAKVADAMRTEDDRALLRRFSQDLPDTRHGGDQPPAGRRIDALEQGFDRRIVERLEFDDRRVTLSGQGDRIGATIRRVR